MSSNEIIFVPASECDANDLVDTLVQSDLAILKESYKDNVEKILSIQYKYNNPGTYVLKNVDEIIGMIKIHLPRSKVGKTVSISTLIGNLGFKDGIRATLLMSNWDEYKLRVGEAYIEYIAIKQQFKNKGYEKIIIEEAIKLAMENDAKYITIFSPEKKDELLEEMEFKFKRNVYSPVAKLYGVNSKWLKYHYTIKKLTPNIQEVVEVVKRRYKYREARSALQLSIWLLLVPIVGGILAYVRGFPLATAFWIGLLIFHIIGIAVIYYEKSLLGKYLISIVMLIEAGNMALRTLNTEVWFDRGWLLLIVLIDIWIAFVILRVSNYIEE